MCRWKNCREPSSGVLFVVTRFIGFSAGQPHECDGGGRRSSVSEPPEFQWLAAGGSLTLDHQAPTHCGTATKFAKVPRSKCPGTSFPFAIIRHQADSLNNPPPCR